MSNQLLVALVTGAACLFVLTWMLAAFLATAGMARTPRLCAHCGERPAKFADDLCNECLIEESLDEPQEIPL